MTIRKILISFLLIFSFCGEVVAAEQLSLSRTIIALYDGIENPIIRETRIHRFVQMPLNHLGLKLKFIDIHKDLPSLKELEDVRGIIEKCPHL